MSKLFSITAPDGTNAVPVTGDVISVAGKVEGGDVTRMRVFGKVFRNNETPPMPPQDSTTPTPTNVTTEASVDANYDFSFSVAGARAPIPPALRNGDNKLAVYLRRADPMTGVAPYQWDGPEVVLFETKLP